MHNTGTVFDIQRMSLHNGEGLRTSVFLKGCPLKCVWCHNPESQKFKPEIFFKVEKCISCGKCASICPNKSHQFIDGLHSYDRTKCAFCFKCSEVCPTNSIQKVGNEFSVEKVMEIVLRDKVFYNTSNGGITISGGEPLFQEDFTLALAKACFEADVNVNIDTSGFGRTDFIKELAMYTNAFLFDIKETNSILHKKFTGVDNELILTNLRILDEMGKTIYLRCPIIPNCNDREDHLKGIATLANSLKYPHEINIIPYHPLGIQKSGWLAKKVDMSSQAFPKKDTINKWVDIITANTSCPVSVI